jgi:hypothetical protein
VQERRLLTLAEMLKCLPSARFARFVPKVMAILVPNLGDDSPPALTAVSSKVLTDFVRMLNDDTAKEHLCALVVAVLPLLERCAALRTDQRGSGKGVSAITRGEVDALNLVRAESHAIRLLRHLILDRFEALHDRFHAIPFIIRSNVPDLEPVISALETAHGSPCLADELGHLISLIRHDSLSIKRTTLRRLNEVLLLRRSDALELTSSNDASVVRLVKELLVLCSQTADPETRLATAECLGSLGAIDPASLHLHEGAARGLAGGADGSSLSAQTPPAPWTVSKVDFAVLLVSDYLVSSLRESSSMEGQAAMISDRTAFAIQVLPHTILLHVFHPPCVTKCLSPCTPGAVEDCAC